MENIIAFVFAATLLTLTPGLDTALVLRTASIEGPGQAVKAALGINVGCFLWGAAVAFGLGAIIAVSEFAYSVLKYCGAAYLCWLGLNMLLSPRCGIGPAGAHPIKRENWFLKGVLGNALNPKVGVFYASFLPQFIPQGSSLIVWTFGLVAIHVVIGSAWSLTLIGATRPLDRFLRNERVVQWMNRTTGLVFLLFAARLAYSKR
ncbi:MULTISPECIES: LysE family translocator [Salinicola]|uniref:Lysine transporter LysE n=1 Tax=Salinicola socius TaxID=404433 RepID=A0A1Q8SUF9_9GAMM|nr:MULTISPECIES: LysE family translocator [Salinicola]OLO05053.1 lysine transporter LysE [Salinicola socius]